MQPDSQFRFYLRTILRSAFPFASLRAISVLLAGLFACLASTAVFAQSSPAVVQAQGAAVWQMQQSGTTAGLRGIFSVDGTIAWASGTGGTVLQTVDGGQHWTHCAVPDGDKDGATLDFRGVQAWDAQTAIVMASGPGEKSRLYKTTDGCGTWRLLFLNPDKDGFWDAVSVADQDNIMIFGDPVDGKFVILDTTDGGRSWEREHTAGLQSTESAGAFAASNSSLLALWVDGVSAFGTGSPSGARIFLECDPCDTKEMWRSLSMPEFPKGKAAGVFSIDARDWRRWIAAGGDYTKPDVSIGTAAWTADGGLHWTASVKPPHGYRSSVQWSEAEKLWITVGTNGSDISRDDGRTWQRLDDGNWNALSLPFVVGPDGRVAKLNPSALPKP
jgi:photosystem II stability/assembly factor-like uncharacterized protein